MSEPIATTSVIVYLVKKYLWETILLALCITILHNALENVGGDKVWVKVAKAVVNGLYASLFFSGVGGYYFGELGLVGGVLVGSLVGLAGVKDFAEKLINKK